MPAAAAPRPRATVPGVRAAGAAVKLSVVIPMFNEEENLRHTLDRLAETLSLFKDGPWEVVVVNDGSLDGTWEQALALARRPEFAWLRVRGYRRNRGRGYALRTGFAAARGEWIVAIDADLSYEPDYILRMTRVLREEDDVDLVLASAYMPGGRVEGVEFKRLFISRLGNTILSWFMSQSGRKVYTITCVVRAYRRHVLDSLDLESDGKDIHLEILSKAIMLGYRYKEIPATLRARLRGKSKFKFKNTATSHLVFALFERPILVFGLLGVLSLLAGTTIGSYLFYLYVKGKWTGSVLLNTGRPMFTLMVMGFLAGVQLISLGVIGSQIVTVRKELIKMQARIREIALARRGESSLGEPDDPDVRAQAAPEEP